MPDQRKLSQAWNDGARALGFRRAGEPWSEVDYGKARGLFYTCIQGDPTMADAWLGLHAVGYQPDTALDRMSENLPQFGEQRRAAGRSLTSRYQGGAYCRFTLDDWEDLDLAQAARWLAAGRTDVAWAYVNRCVSDREARRLLVGRLLFADGDYESMLPLMESLTVNRRLAPEARLYTGLALAKREMFGEAERVLSDAAARTDNPDLAMEATYFRGCALRQMGRAPEARQCLEWVYRHDPRYREVGELLANPAMPGFVTEPLAPPDSWSGPREDLGQLMAELDAQIGLSEVKSQVRAVAAQVHARSLRADRGLTVVNTSNHLVFAGPPGTGKTTIARLVGRIYAALGVLRGTAFVEATRPDLVGEYVGHTAPKTNAKIDEAMDGVLFIDEAYSLSSSSADGVDSYGREAIETLLKRMEDDRDRLVVIIAGYRERLQDFLGSNPGLRSRFGTMIEFTSYTPEELVAIAHRFADLAGDVWGEGALDVMRDAIGEAVACGWIDELGNGRFVRNVFEAACRARDLRLFNMVTGAAGSGGALGAAGAAGMPGTWGAAGAPGTAGSIGQVGVAGAHPGEPGGSGDAADGAPLLPDNRQLSTIEVTDATAAANEILGPLRRRHIDQVEAELRSIAGP